MSVQTDAHVSYNYTRSISIQPNIAVPLLLVLSGISDENKAGLYVRIPLMLAKILSY